MDQKAQVEEEFRAKRSKSSIRSAQSSQSKGVGHTQKLRKWSSAFDDLLESLRLEATLLNSAESPLIVRRRERQEARARRLAEAHALAEAQLEKASRQRELLALREERASQERARLEARAEQLAKEAQQRHISAPPPSSDDWDASIEYTDDGSARPRAGKVVDLEASDPPLELSISPDDSVFVDPDSLKPLPKTSSISPELAEIKRSIPPRPRARVTHSPAPMLLAGLDLNPQVIFNSLKGVLSPPPRITDEYSFIGLGSDPMRIISEVPWSSDIEIVWEGVDYDNIQEEIKGHGSLSLAPRAFSPASPLPRRTISLRLKSTESAHEVSSYEEGSVPLEEDFNLSDFEEHRDSELFEMHQAYRALEDRVEDLGFDDEPRVDDDLYDRSWDQGPITLDEPSFTTPRVEAESGSDTSAQPKDRGAIFSVDDPFEALDDIHFDQSRLMGDFNWSEGTPTHVFGDEPTPTDVFDDGREDTHGSHRPSTPSDPTERELLDEEGMRPRIQEASQKREKGLLSRFFGRR
jgi:hypothetical protein